MDLVDAENNMSEDVENIKNASILALQAIDQEFPLRKKTSSEYVRFLRRNVVIPEACTIMVLIYLRRMRAAGSAMTTEEPFTVLTLCVGLMVAFKYHAGKKFTTGLFAHASGLPLKRLNACESLFMDAHAWNVHITPEEFAETCAQLERAEEHRKWRNECGLARCVQRLREE
jgi:hypothetical protein